ncbi:MAG: hypothetical protein EXR67_03465 [Dehalococcoidia bacterium]|nr:hypothetical protein [Dehalococcoidia bacterium]
MHRLFLLCLALAGLLAVACTSQAAKQPVSTASDVVVIPAMSELVRGSQRLTFGVFDSDGNQLDQPSVTVKMSYLDGDKYVAKGQYTAQYQKITVGVPDVHANGVSESHIDVPGFYLVPAVTIDKRGVWQAEVAITLKGAAKTGTLALQVVAKTDTPAIGAQVPASKTPTAKDVKDLSEITSRTPPEPFFLQTSIAQEVQARHPFVVAFATPAFCVTRMCGPVLEIARKVAVNTGNAQLSGNKVDFIQVEPYDLTIARTKGQLSPVPAFTEWGLHTEPYIFVVDAQGRVAAKFEGLLTPDELAAAVKKVSQ